MARDQISADTGARYASTGWSAGRVASLDVQRGLIIVLMAIDHARGFVARNHPGEFWGSPLPQYHGDWLAFLTRLVTHPCAPGFMFLMGAGAALFSVTRVRAGWSPMRVTGHLVLRGVVLVVLGQLFESTAATFATAAGVRGESYGLRVPGAPGPVSVVWGVLYGLGSALVIAAPLVRMAPWALVLAAAACVLATHWLTPSPAHIGDPIHPLLGMLAVPGIASPVVTVYPTIPWLAPTLLGVAFGRALEHDRHPTFRRTALAGVACLAAFVALRASGGFGSLHPVDPGWIGFLNITKYPPSLTFLLFALGVNFVLLGAFELGRAAESRWLVPLRVYGSVPLFFFVTHLWLYAAIGRLFPEGTTIPAMYPIWLLGLVMLYLPCMWYGELKRRSSPGSVLRLL
jgi:uncharacterized membrane protein